jgi:NADPH-dependent glutamate synthase beta subunit-like oxidoreductase
MDKGHPVDKQIVIIGAGPAGLTAARDLARLGHRSTVFEALPMPGGMITVGMPRFRLPREVRQADIDDIVKLGIEIKSPGHTRPSEALRLPGGQCPAVHDPAGLSLTRDATSWLSS